METPPSIQFTDLEVPMSSLFSRAHQGPISRQWTRVQFPISNDWDAHIKIETWLTQYSTGRWASYHYSDPKGKKDDYMMVVRFEKRDDALLFKLRGGHQAGDNP